MRGKYREALMSRQAKIAVWGVGYIGLSTLSHYGRNGVLGVGVDSDPDVIESLTRNPADYLAEYKYWLGFDNTYLFNRQTITLLSRIEDLKKHRILVHFICVPTEENGEPDLSTFYKVVETILGLNDSSEEDILIVVESTLIPGTAQQVYNDMIRHKYPWIHLCVSPRRDWFESGNHNLESLHRVYGASSGKGDEMAEQVLSIVCRNLVKATDFQIPELTKCVENAFRHINITFANQLSDAFPGLDIREVLAIAGTKWNVDTYFPSLGTGGHCIPLSSKYLLRAENLKYVPNLLKLTVEYDQQRPLDICEMLLSTGAEKIAVFGISYRQNIKVSKYSPALSMINYLQSRGRTLFVNDPYYTAEEIEALCPGTYFDHLDYQAYSQFDLLVLSTNHRFYNAINVYELVKYLNPGLLLLDNNGSWEQHSELFKAARIEYRLIGRANWRDF